MVKWPRYIRLQRQRKLLKMRLKVPPSIAQFSKTLDLNTATQLFKLLEKYKKEEKAAKKERLKAMAGGAKSAKPYFVKCGINHVTKLIESKRAKLVVIAHDVDPIETIVWMPALCRQMDIPYCIVKGKARLGTVVGMKTATCLCLTEVKQGDSAELAKLCESVKTSFNDEGEKLRRTWGGGVMGIKNRARMNKLKKRLAADAAKKL